MTVGLRRFVAGAPGSARGAIGRYGGGLLVALAATVLAVGIGALEWSASDRSADHSADAYADAVFSELPQNAAILVWWDAASPLWYGEYVEGRRPDLLIVDDSNIVYEGWGTREARIASLICERPVYTLRPSDGELAPTEEDYRVTPVLTVPAAFGTPTASTTRPIYLVQPLDPATCGG